uniref:Uncharacterized protein n=1 Tax=Rhizophora mucronata TaxID=61149 RepID=A0A2P2QER6_RHIMU
MINAFNIISRFEKLIEMLPR